MSDGFIFSLFCGGDMLPRDGDAKVCLFFSDRIV